MGGDELVIVRRQGNPWIALPRTKEYHYLVPEDPYGREHRVQLPDCTALMLNVPETAKPGQCLKLVLSEGVWVVKLIASLPKVVSQPPTANGAVYKGLLTVITEQGYSMKKLPLDERDVLHVNVPICGVFDEHSLLGNHLHDNLATHGASSATVLATDLSGKHSLHWHIAERWCSLVHTDVRMFTCPMDLAHDPLPQAGLCIAVHPEVTKGGCWFQIIGSIIRSSCRGLCVIVTFFQHEMLTVLNMIDMYKSEGTVVKVEENPYYEDHELPESPDMRYIILIAGGDD